MFVSSLPQVAAEASQSGQSGQTGQTGKTGIIGPSVPAPAGSEGGFAAWLQSGLQPPTALPALIALPQADLPPGMSTALQNFPDITAGQLSGPDANAVLNGAPGRATFPAQGAQAFSQLATGRMPDQTGLMPGLVTGQGSGHKPEQTTGQTTGQPIGQAGRSVDGPPVITATMDANKGDPALARIAGLVLANEVAGSQGQKSGAAFTGQTDLPTATGRIHSESAPQTAAQNATQPQLPFLPSRPQMLTGQSPQASTSDATGKPNPSINSADIAVQMARYKAEGQNQFTIRLTPESMGTITIRLNVGANSNLTAQMLVEKPETLALLQKDMAGLEKALKAQGFTTSTGDLTVALKAAGSLARGGDAAMNNASDQRFGQSQSQTQNPAQNATQNAAQGQTTAQSQNAANPAQALNAQQASNPHLAASGGADRPGSGMPLSSGDMGFQQSHQDRGTDGQDGFDHGPHGQFGHLEADDAETISPEIASVIANAYHGRNFLIGMSSRIDLSI